MSQTAPPGRLWCVRLANILLRMNGCRKLCYKHAFASSRLKGRDQSPTVHHPQADRSTRPPPIRRQSTQQHSAATPPGVFVSMLLNPKCGRVWVARVLLAASTHGCGSTPQSQPVQNSPLTRRHEPSICDIAAANQPVSCSTLAGVGASGQMQLGVGQPQGLLAGSSTTNSRHPSGLLREDMPRFGLAPQPIHDTSGFTTGIHALSDSVCYKGTALISQPTDKPKHQHTEHVCHTTALDRVLVCSILR